MPDHIDKYTDQQEAAYARKIAATYKKAAQEVRRQITEFTAKHKAKAAKLLQQVTAGEISMADYQAWLQGQVFIGKQWQTKLDDIVRVYTDADEKARQLMRGTVRDVFTESANYAAYQLEDRLGAAVDFHLYDASTVDRLMRTNPQMLPEWKINEKKDYTWNAQRVRSTLTRAIIEGKPIPDIAEELGQQLATGNAKKMVLFARTAMTGAQNAGRVERLHDTQQMGIRVKKKWLAAHDARVRDTHAYLDGQERDVDEDFEVGDMHIAYPGDPTAPPELVYNCRCTMIYVYPEHQAEHDGEKTESYEEWLEEKRGKKEEIEASSTAKTAEYTFENLESQKFQEELTATLGGFDDVHRQRYGELYSHARVEVGEGGSHYDPKTNIIHIEEGDPDAFTPIHEGTHYQDDNTVVEWDETITGTRRKRDEDGNVVRDSEGRIVREEYSETFHHSDNVRGYIRSQYTDEQRSADYQTMWRALGVDPYTSSQDEKVDAFLKWRSSEIRTIDRGFEAMAHITDMMSGLCNDEGMMSLVGGHPSEYWMSDSSLLPAEALAGFCVCDSFGYTDALDLMRKLAPNLFELLQKGNEMLWNSGTMFGATVSHK